MDTTSQQANPEAKTPPQVTMETCPRCQAKIPVYLYYPNWCDQCGWNLEPPGRPGRLSLSQKLYTALKQKSSQQLLDEMLAKPPTRPKFPPARLLAYPIAAFVHLVTPAALAFGAWLCIFAFPTFHLLGILLGVSWLMMVAFVLLPRIPRLSVRPLPRDQFPALYRAADQVAGALGSQPVKDLYSDLRYNAGIGRFGWRRKQALILGLPLLAVLNEQELVALLAHELAHNVNGDPNRGFFLGTALNSLEGWYAIINPQNRWNFRPGCGMVLIVLVNLLCIPIAGLIWLLHYALDALLWLDSYRAEYLADWLGVQAAGTNAMLAVLVKTRFSETYIRMLKYAYQSQRMDGLFDQLEQRVSQAPEREIERLRRLEEFSATSLYSNHPSTENRTAVIKARGVSSARVVLSMIDASQLKQELEPLMQRTLQMFSKLDNDSFRKIYRGAW